MVDFQSRDTSRGLDDGDDEPQENDTAETDPQARVTGDDEQAADESPERGVAVVTIATGRTIEEDEAGDAVVEEIDRAGGHVVTRELIGASFDGVQRIVDSLAERRDVYAVVTTGGTSVEPDDVTIEAIQPMLEKELPGFGELFRRSCHEQAGTAVIRTRATAGVLDGVAIFSLPGDADLTREGVRDIVVPEASPLAALAENGEAGDEA